MEKITFENLRKNPAIENCYQAIRTINGEDISISINPDDVDIEKTIELANKIINNFEFYETKARKKIVEDFLKEYNESWRNYQQWDGEQWHDVSKPELNAPEFSKNLLLKAVEFLSDSGIDFVYSENGLFGDHLLIAQSFDKENFDFSTMYG